MTDAKMFVVGLICSPRPRVIERVKYILYLRMVITGEYWNVDFYQNQNNLLGEAKFRSYFD